MNELNSVGGEYVKLHDTDTKQATIYVLKQPCQIVSVSVMSLSTPVYASARKFRSVCSGKDKSITFHCISCYFVECNQTDGCISS